MIRVYKDRLEHEFYEDGAILKLNLANSEAGITPYFDDAVVFEADVTVEDFLRIVYSYQHEVDMSFGSSLNGYPLEIFWRELPQDVGIDEHLIYAEFSHDVRVQDGFMKMSCRFGAVGVDVYGDGDAIAYSVEYASISAYKHLVIVPNDAFVIYDGEHVVFQAKREFTLYDVISALLFEISYHGTPEDRAAALEAILEDLRQSGEITIESSDSPSIAAASRQREIENLEGQLADLLAKEEYEAAAKVRDRVAMLKDSGKTRDRV